MFLIPCNAQVEEWVGSPLFVPETGVLAVARGGDTTKAGPFLIIFRAKYRTKKTDTTKGGSAAGTD